MVTTLADLQDSVSSLEKAVIAKLSALTRDNALQLCRMRALLQGMDRQLDMVLQISAPAPAPSAPQCQHLRQEAKRSKCCGTIPILICANAQAASTYGQEVSQAVCSACQHTQP